MEVNKKLPKTIRKYVRSYNTKLISKPVQGNKNMRVLKTKISTGKHRTAKIKDCRGVIQEQQREM